MTQLTDITSLNKILSDTIEHQHIDDNSLNDIDARIKALGVLTIMQEWAKVKALQKPIKGVALRDTQLLVNELAQVILMRITEENDEQPGGSVAQQAAAPARAAAANGGAAAAAAAAPQRAQLTRAEREQIVRERDTKMNGIKEAKRELTRWTERLDKLTGQIFPQDAGAQDTCYYPAFVEYQARDLLSLEDIDCGSYVIIPHNIYPETYRIVIKLELENGGSTIKVSETFHLAANKKYRYGVLEVSYDDLYDLIKGVFRKDDTVSYFDPLKRNSAKRHIENKIQALRAIVGQ